MPEALAEQPAVGRLAGVYWERLQSLLDGPEIIESEEDERRFYMRQKERNRELNDIGSAEEETMCVEALGAMQRVRQKDWWATHPGERAAVDRQLDAIFLARISLRFLLEHYVACGEPPREGFAGILQDNLCPVALCNELALTVHAQVVHAPRMVARPGEIESSPSPHQLAFKPTGACGARRGSED